MARISEFICLSWYAMLPDLVILIKNKKTQTTVFSHLALGTILLWSNNQEITLQTM